MDITKNLKLKKPSYDDPVDIADLNENADIVDQALTLKADKTELPIIVTGAAAATSENCPPGAWYGKYE